MATARKITCEVGRKIRSAPEAQPNSSNNPRERRAGNMRIKITELDATTDDVALILSASIVKGRAGDQQMCSHKEYGTGCKAGYEDEDVDDLNDGSEAQWKSKIDAYRAGYSDGKDRDDSLSDAYADGYGDGVDAYMEKLEGLVEPDVLEEMRDKLYSILRESPVEKGKSGLERER